MSPQQACTRELFIHISDAQTQKSGRLLSFFLLLEAKYYTETPKLQNISILNQPPPQIDFWCSVFRPG